MKLLFVASITLASVLATADSYVGEFKGSVCHVTTKKVGPTMYINLNGRSFVADLSNMSAFIDFSKNQTTPIGTTTTYPAGEINHKGESFQAIFVTDKSGAPLFIAVESDQLYPFHCYKLKSVN